MNTLSRTQQLKNVLKVAGIYILYVYGMSMYMMYGQAEGSTVHKHCRPFAIYNTNTSLLSAVCHRWDGVGEGGEEVKGGKANRGK